MSDEPRPPTRRSRSSLAEVLTGTGVLVAAGVLAILLGSVLGVLTWLNLREADEEPDGPVQVETERAVSRRGGFAVTVPLDMEVRRRGRTMELRAADPELVINIGPASSGRLAPAHRTFLRTVDRGYARVRVIGRERGEVDGRRSRTTSGTAVNENDVPIRFVVVTVAARPRNYTLVAFTGRDTPPDEVLPRLNAVVNGFEVLPR
jgi:hypothetical protein